MSARIQTLSRPLWLLWRLSRRVWVRVTMISVLAVIAAGSAPLLQWLIPSDLAGRLGTDAVRPILNVLATSMLAVTTFSLSVMVSAHRAAADNVTPRTHRLLLADPTTQTVLATFLGAFVYALVSIVLINAGVFDERSVAISFVFTVFVIALVVAAILRWIEHLSGLGSMLETARKVEAAAIDALKARVASPWLGGRPASEAPAKLGHAVYADCIGYLKHIDVEALQKLADNEACDICLCMLPGGFAAPGQPLAKVADPGHDESVRRAFSIGDAREFDQDPRFGLIVLSEVASRALSPGINDPGTAIDVIGRLLRVLMLWEEPQRERLEARPSGRLFVPALEPADLVDDAFGALARDGAAMIEVQVRLQKALRTLIAHTPEPLSNAARDLSDRAFDHARAALVLDEDQAVLEALVKKEVQ